MSLRLVKKQKFDLGNPETHSKLPSSSSSGDSSLIPAIVYRREAKTFGSAGGKSGSYASYEVTILEDANVPHSLSKNEKENFKFFGIEDEAAKLGVDPKTLLLRPPLPIKAGTKISFNCFKESGGEKVAKYSRVNITLHYSIGFEISDKTSKSTDPITGEEVDTVTRRRDDPLISFRGNVMYDSEPDYNSLRSLVRHCQIPTQEQLEKYNQSFANASSIHPQFESLVLPSGKVNFTAVSLDDLANRSTYNYHPATWFEVYNPLYTLEFDSPFINIDDEYLNNGPVVFKAMIPETKEGENASYLHKKANTEIRKPCIRDAGNHLMGISVISDCEAAIDIPIWNATEIYGISDPSLWSAVGPQLWRATRALVFSQIRVSESANMDETVKEMLNVNRIINGYNSFVLDHTTTLKWAGLRIPQSVVIDTLCPKGKGGKMESSYASVNPFMPSASVQPPWICLNEFTGKIASTFDHEEFDFYAIPPYMVLGNELLKSHAGQILTTLNFYEKNSSSDCETSNIAEFTEWTKVDFFASKIAYYAIPKQNRVLTFNL